MTLRTDDENLSAARRRDEICDAFERELRAGRSPSVEQHLLKVALGERPALLRELLQLEWDYARKESRSLAVETYCERFPDQSPVIRDLFQQWLSTLQSRRTIVPSGSSADGSAADESVPKILGQYQLVEQLGQGSFGTVYKAYDRQLDRFVALKLPHSQIRRAELLRFEREALAAARLQHPNIVTVYQAGQVADRQFIAAEFVSGRDLKQVLKSSETADLRSQVTWIRDAAKALGYAHSMGIVHRDIKPANLMVGTDGRIRLMDFGLARRLDDATALTVDGDIVGTPAYMSPEQARGMIGQVGPASDQCSLGLILYEMLTGRVPIRGGVLEVIRRIGADEEPVAPRCIQPDIPADLEAICLKSISRDPRHRYSNMDDFAADLQRWLDGEPVVARPLTRWQQAVRHVRRRPQFYGIAALALLAITASIAAGSYARFQSQRADSATQRSELAETEVGHRQATIESQQKSLVDVRTESGEHQRRAERRAYVVTIKQLADAFASGSLIPDLARQQLDGCPAAERNWEWHYFDRLLGTPSRTLLTSEVPLRDALLDPEARRIAVFDETGEIQIVDALTGVRERAFPSDRVDSQHMAWSKSQPYELLAADRHRGVAAWPLDDVNKPTVLYNTDFVFGKDLKDLSYPSTEIEELVKGMKQESAMPNAPPAVRLFRDFRPPPQLPRLDGHGSAVDIDASGRHVAVGGDRFVQVWDRQERQRKHLLLLDRNSHVQTVAFSPDGRMVAGYAQSGEVAVWETESGKVILKRSLAAYADGLAWSPASDWLYVPAPDHEVGAIRIADAAMLTSFPEHGDHVTALAVNRAGTQLLTGSEDHSICLWQLPQLECLGRYWGHREGVNRVQFLPDGRSFVSSTGREIRRWDTEAPPPALRDPEFLSLPQQPEQLYEHFGYVARFAVSPNSDRIAFAHRGRVSLRGLREPLPEITLDIFAPAPASSGTIQAMAFSPNGKWFAAASNPGLVHVWSTSQWKELPVVKPRDLVSGSGDVAFSRDSRLLACASSNGLVIINTDRFAVRTTLPELKSQPVLECSPTADLVAATGRDGVIHLVRLSDGRPLKQLRGHGLPRPFISSTGPSGVLDLVFTPDGTLLASAGADATIRLWDVETGHQVGELTGHGASVTSLAIHPNGTRLFSGGNDDTVRVWDLSERQELFSLRHSPGNSQVTSIVVTADGRDVIVADEGRLHRYLSSMHLGAQAPERLELERPIEGRAGSAAST